MCLVLHAPAHSSLRLPINQWETVLKSAGSNMSVLKQKGVYISIGEGGWHCQTTIGQVASHAHGLYQTRQEGGGVRQGKVKSMGLWHCLRPRAGQC